MHGVIYAAAGRGYYELAVQSVRSLRQHNPGVQVDLFTDQSDIDHSLFDRVLPIPDGATPKLASLPHSRFERTLYLDCDTLVLASFDDLFRLLDRFDLAVAHDVRRTSSLIREGFEVQTPYAFPQMNAGVFLYSARPKMRAFLEAWSHAYAQAGVTRDQVTLRDLLWTSDLSFYVLPEEFNLRRTTCLDAWEPLDVRPTILHSHRLLQHLRGSPMQISDVETLVEAERIALREEWDAFGDLQTVCPVTRFHAAEQAADRIRDLGTIVTEKKPELSSEDGARQFTGT